MDNGDQTNTTENQTAAEQTEPNDTNLNLPIPSTTITTTTTAADEQVEQIATAHNDDQPDTQLITSNVIVEPQSDISVASHIDTATDTIIRTNNSDPAPDTADLETNRTEVKNSLTAQSLVVDEKSSTNQPQHPTSIDVTTTNDDELSSLDAALDNLNDQVSSLLDEASNNKSDSPDSPLDEALATLNNEVLGLLKESRKIQDELQKTNETKGEAKGVDSKVSSRCGSSQAINKKDGNQYFDYNLYRERSASPPLHPINTYHWEDIRRDKEKGGYPWTYLHPQDLAAQAKAKQTAKAAKLENQCEESCEKDGNEDETNEEAEEIVEGAAAYRIQIQHPSPQPSPQSSIELPASFLPEPTSNANDLFSFNFDNIDTQRAIDSYSVKSSVKNSSSGILEVLQDLEAEEERENERKKNTTQKHITTQSNQDLSTFKPKEETKRFALRSLLKRTHSAPKKMQVSKTRADDLEDDSGEQSTPPVKCCHPIVEKLKTMADKQLHKKSSKKPPKEKPIKKVPLPNDKKIVLAEQTTIISLRDSPKADRKKVAAYVEKRDSDDFVEIVQLDESPTESRKRRDEVRKEEDLDKEWEKIEQLELENELKRENEKGFVVPSNVTGHDTDPTVEELLEEEFKNDPPKKAPRKTKEHIYEEIETPGAIKTFQAEKLGKPANMFACAVLHSVLNKDEFKENLVKQNAKEDAEELEKIAAKQVVDLETSQKEQPPIPDEIIDLTPQIAKIESELLEVPTNDEETKSDIEITVETSADIEHADTANESDESKLKTDSKKDVLTKEEKKVKFSQSTEEYQEKLAAEKGPDKEDVELPEHIKVAKRWSNMSDHEYEPIGEPVAVSEQSPERPFVTISGPDSPTTDLPKPDVVYVEEKINIDDYTDTESPLRSITPYTDISRTEDVHTSQIDDSAIEELPLRREDRKKKSFISNAGEHTKSLQNKISSQASNLRTKFRRSMKSNSSTTSSQKASGSNLKSSLKSSPKASTPKERKKFKRIDIANKIKSIHMPEIPKFKLPDKFKLSRGDAPLEDAPITTRTVTTEEPLNEPDMVLSTDGTPTVVSVKTEEIFETKGTPKKLFEFGSYPKIFNRFKPHSKPDEHDVTDFVSEDTQRDTATQPSSSSFSTHFATVPRAATRIKKSIISKWNKSSLSRSDRDDSESMQQGSTLPHDDMREDSMERRIRLAAKISMEDEEEPLGILQTKEQLQLASYDEENRAIHEISRAREKEFKARKPLTHQDSDLVSEESNRDIDWEECERIRNKIMGTQRPPTYEFEEEPKRMPRRRRDRNDSNFSTEETQSSGSSGDRRRTGVIENIDDDEFFLRQRGVSQDNAEISKYISSAIREGLNDPSYPYETNADFPDEYQFDERPRKPLRRRHDGFNRSFESYDDYRHEHLSDHEIPVATQYFPRHDDENISFYDNEYTDDLDHVNILSRENEHYDSDIENEEFNAIDEKPEVPKRRRKAPAPPQQDSFETNEEVLIYRSEPSFTVPVDEPVDAHFIVKPIRKNRSISSKSDLAPDTHRESIERETTTTTVEKYSPSNSRYTIDIKESNGYATVKKEPPARPPAPSRRLKRSTKSLGESSSKPDNSRPAFKDSPFPERPKRNFNVFGPTRPPRRGSCSSLVDQHKPPSIAPSDGTQYEEIDDELNDQDNEFYPHKMQNRPLPPPPRPPRDKRRRNKSNIDPKFDDNDDAEAIASSFDNASEFSTREFIGTEMATQTSLDIEDLMNDDIPLEELSAGSYPRTVEEILRSNDTIQTTQPETFRNTSDDNLSRGIQKFRESNQRSFSERSRASTSERPPSRPITPSALLIEQRIARSPIQTDATLTVQPVDDIPKTDYRTDSAESEYVPYADEPDNSQIDTEDERIINAAIRRYQRLSNERGTSPRAATPKPDESNLDDDAVTLEAPLPPPRRKSSASAVQMTDTINVPLAEAESISIASTQDLNRFTPEPSNDLSTEPNHTHVDSLTVVNIQSTEKDNQQSGTKPLSSTVQITPEVMQEIIERVRETLPVQPDHHESESIVQEEIVKKTTIEKESTGKKESGEPPERPPTPTDYTPTSEIPASFYQLRTGISDDESVPPMPPSAIPKHRPRKHNRRPDSSTEDEHTRRHHHHHHGRSPDLSIADLSGQLIRACGRALSSTLNTAGHSLFDFLRSLTKNQDDQQKDLSLVLVILIIIVASLMMLGINGDRSVHHHHWDYFNPPDNIGRR